MRFTATKPAKRVALVAALGVGLLTATGCGYINAQQTTHTYSASDGIRTDIGTLQLRNMLIVAADNPNSSSSPSTGGTGRLLGTIFNTSDKDVTLTLKDDASTVRIDVPKKGEVELSKPGKDVTLTKAGAVPGALAKIAMSADGASQDVEIPVLDGSLAEYRQYIPTPSATSSASPSGSASGSATSSASPSGSASGSATGSASASATPSR